MNDLARTLAFAFQRKGQPAMERSRLLHLLAFDLRWFSPDPAKRIIQRATQAGLLVEEGDKVRLAFDAATIEIPLNFRPAESLADEDGPVELPAGVAPPPPPSGADDERARRGGLLDLEVAALVVARRAGADVRDQAREAEARLTSGAPRRS